MSEFVPRGYVSIREALNQLGRKMYPSDWTGEEHKARRGLIGQEEWLKIKDLPPARGGGATSSEPFAKPLTARTPSPSNDPSSSVYQAEYRARERYAAACQRLRVRLEAGDLEAAVWDRFTGILHRAPASLWRQHGADRMIEKGQAPIPRNPNVGQLVVRVFAEASEHGKPMPNAKIKEAIAALKAKNATKTLTRPQQEDFIRESFPDYRITKRQIAEIFGAVPVDIGRPRKTNKPVS